MAKKILVCLIVLALLFPMISAIDTEITIKTTSFSNVNLNILAQNSVESIERFNEDADKYGDLVFIYSGTLEKFDLNYYVKKNDKKVDSGILKGNLAGEPIYIEAVPEGVELIFAPVINQTNQTEQSELNQTDLNQSELNESINDYNTEIEKGISGFAIFGEDGLISKNALYYMGGAIMLAMLIFLGFKLYNHRPKPQREIKIRKLSELKKQQEDKKDKEDKDKDKQEQEEKIDDLKQEKKEKIGDYKELIEGAEKKIKEAQDEINKLKHKDKIKEIRKRIADEEEELRKLEE